jgi:hypothetical protein
MLLEFSKERAEEEAMDDKFWAINDSECLKKTLIKAVYKVMHLMHVFFHV